VTPGRSAPAGAGPVLPACEVGEEDAVHPFIPEDEARLSGWMARHARVAWSVFSTPWEIEHELLHELSVPLNLDGNAQHPFQASLSTLRRTMKDQARHKVVWW